MNRLQTFIERLGPGMFLRDTQVAELVSIDRLHPVIVRCGGVRFTCGAQYLETMIAMVEKAGDYVRDVSMPVGSRERAAEWRPEPPMRPLTMRPARVLGTVAEANRRPVEFNENDCGGVFDGHGVISDADPGL